MQEARGNCTERNFETFYSSLNISRTTEQKTISKGRVAGMGDKSSYVQILVLKLKGIDHLDHLSLHDRTVVKRILRN